MKRYAEGTAVPVARTRGQIDQLLREWGAEGVQWSDSFALGLVTLRFVWPRMIDGQTCRFLARLQLRLPTEDELEKRCLNQRTYLISESKLAAAKAALGREEHRLLLLWLKASFHAIEAGIISAEALFLPFLEGADGSTVAERALPRLPTLLGAGADRLLAAGGTP